MRRREKRNYLNAGIPQDMLAEGARVTLMGMRVVLVEGQRGVVEMGETGIRIKTDDGVVNIKGESMVLRELSADAAMINSECIQEISFSR